MTNQTEVKTELENTPQRVAIELDKIRNEGIFVQVHVGGASLMTRQTTLAERGLISGDIRRELQTAGVTLTVPRESYKKFHSIENKVRANCDRASFDIKGFKPWRFMTWDMAAAWFEAHQKYADQAVALCNELIENLPTWTSVVTLKYTAAGSAAWNSLAANAQKRGDRSFEMFGVEWNIRSTRDAEQFVVKVVELAVAQIPTASAIRANMRVTFEVALPQLGSEIQAEIAAWDTNRAERAEARQRLLFAEGEAAKLNKEKREREFERSVREEAVKTAVAKRVREQLVEVTSPYDDAINSLRAKMAAYARRALAAINKSGKVTGPTANSLRNMIDLYSTMKFGTDDDLARMMKAVDDELKIAGERVEKGGAPTVVDKMVLADLLGKLADIPLKAATVAEAAADVAELVGTIDKDENEPPAPKSEARKASKRVVDIDALEMGD